MWYKVANASEYLVITGVGIDDIKLAKKAWIMPGQTCTVFDMTPVNYTFQVQAMSSEMLPFTLPAVFTIGPRTDDMPSLHKYAKLLCRQDQLSNNVRDLVLGIIEGETRVLAASMTMEDVFKMTKEFKEQVFDKVQLELNQFGLWIYNANVKQLVDAPGQEYFSYLGQKIQMEAANKARVDVAEAKKNGEIGSKERQGLTLQNAAKINAETKIFRTKREGEEKMEGIRTRTQVKVFENMREAEVAEANADLMKKKAGWTKEAHVAEVEASKAVALREAELQKEVERMNALTRKEKLTAELLTEANVEYETQVQSANSEFYKEQKATDAVLYQREKEAEAQKATAEAQLYARQQAADGDFYARKKATEAELYARQQAADAKCYARKKEAEGLMALGHAQGAYLLSLLDPVGGNYAAIRDFMMIKSGMLQEVAKINAEAVRGLKPKISIWTNGCGEGGDGGANGAMKEIAGVYKALPPLFHTVHEQTGI
ncbi:hypothetical protein ACFX2A_017515 [Malus domestica]